MSRYRDDDDDALMSAFAGGDDRAFDELVRRHGSSVLGFLIRSVGDRRLAEDVWSETFIRVVRARGRYEGRQGFRSWLFTIARRCAMDATRGVRRKRALADRVEAEPAERSRAPVGTGRLEAADRAGRLDAALAALPEQHRAAVVLAYRYDFDTSEIARVLGLRDQQVREKLSYARRRLRGLLESPED